VELLNAPTGRSENGFWSATSAAEPKLSFFEYGVISFPQSLQHVIAEAEPTSGTLMLTAEETAQAPGARTGTPLHGTLANVNAHCNGTLASPSATPAGFICLYVGKEERENATVFGIVNEKGEEGTSLTGAAAEFSRESVEGTSKITLIGTWGLDAA
jgi:hypothetical protein